MTTNRLSHKLFIARASRNLLRIRAVILGLQQGGLPQLFDAEVEEEPGIEPTLVPPADLRFEPLRRDLDNTIILIPAGGG